MLKNVKMFMVLTKHQKSNSIIIENENSIS